MEQEIINEILDEQEQTYCRQFFENERMREAVKKILLAPVYYQGIMKKGKKAKTGLNWAIQYLSNTNENLGATVRACAEALRFVEDGFRILSTIKKEQPSPVITKNPAR